GGEPPLQGDPAPQAKGFPPRFGKSNGAGPAGLGHDGHPRAAHAGGAAATTLPRRGLPLLPGAHADHGARCRSVVGRGNPPPHQVPEPLHDDVGVRTEVSARGSHSFHEYARQAEGALRVRPSGAVVRPMPARGRGAAVSRGRPGALPARDRVARLPLARTPGGICTRLGSVVAGSISMRSREVEATARARAWLALTLVPGLGPGRARRLAEHAGGPEAACALGPAALARAGIDPASVAAWSEGPR